mmetsp:Transcript_101698/g.286726  ORF Transcript_101698/g.286726 Transcript_101698/m.286726 type:complete len:213 (+) Transcript_101698:131-769(+)
MSYSLSEASLKSSAGSMVLLVELWLLCVGRNGLQTTTPSALPSLGAHRFDTSSCFRPRRSAGKCTLLFCTPAVGAGFCVQSAQQPKGASLLVPQSAEAVPLATSGAAHVPADALCRADLPCVLAWFLDDLLADLAGTPIVSRGQVASVTTSFSPALRPLRGVLSCLSRAPASPNAPPWLASCSLRGVLSRLVGPQVSTTSSPWPAPILPRRL